MLQAPIENFLEQTRDRRPEFNVQWLPLGRAFAFLIFFRLPGVDCTKHQSHKMRGFTLGNNAYFTKVKHNCSSAWKTIRKNRLDVYIPIFLICTLFFSLLTIFFVRVEPHLGDGVAQGTSFDTDNIRLLGLGDTGGIDLQVSGTNSNNYTNIDDFWIRNYFRTGGFFIRELNLKIEELDLIVFDPTKNEDLNLGKVEIKPFYVRIVDKRSTPMDLLVTLWPNGKGLRGMLKKLLLDSKAKLRLRGDAKVKVYVFNGFVPVSSISIPLDIEF
jgi:hypothetical protein